MTKSGKKRLTGASLGGGASLALAPSVVGIGGRSKLEVPGGGTLGGGGRCP